MGGSSDIEQLELAGSMDPQGTSYLSNDNFGNTRLNFWRIDEAELLDLGFWMPLSIESSERFVQYQLVWIKELDNVVR